LTIDSVGVPSTARTILGQEGVASLVHPVQVLDYVDDHLAAVRGPHQLAHDPAQRPLPRLAADWGRGPLRVGDAEKVEEERQIVEEGWVEQEQAAGDPLPRGALGVALVDPEVGPQHLQDRHEGDCPSVRLRLRLVDLDAAAAAVLGELVAEAALSHARLGDDPDHAAFAVLGPFQRLLQRRHLLGAADEAGEAALAREVEPRAGRADAPQLEDPHRPAGTLDLELAQVLQLEEPARLLRRRFRQVGLSGLRQRLHPLREPDRVADRRVLAVALRADCASDDLAGVDADPHREVEAVPAAQLARVDADVVEHP
jgi:hypothetical protein